MRTYAVIKLHPVSWGVWYIPYGIPTDTKRRIVNELFSRGSTQPRAQRTANFNKKELEMMTLNIKMKRALCIDGFWWPPEAIKWAIEYKKNWILAVINFLLMAQAFPSVYKIAKVVLLPKKDEDLNASSSYWPLCVLNTLSKLYESLFKERLLEEQEEKQGLSSS